MHSRQTTLIAAAGCLAFGVISGVQAVGLRIARDLDPQYVRTIALQLVPWLAWSALLPLVMRAAAQWPLFGGGWRRHAGRYGLGFVAALVAHALVTFLPVAWLRDDLSLGTPSLSSVLVAYEIVLVTTAATSLLQLALLVALCQALVANDVARERERVASSLVAQLAEAQLAALRAQLEPHFLFNSLNAISGHLRDDPAIAEEMVERLSALLRMTLSQANVSTVTLAQELDFIGHYLGIHEIRFGERLTVHYDVDPAVEDAIVPSMLLQPVVENAITHGVSRRRRPSRVTIRAHEANGRLHITVADEARDSSTQAPEIVQPSVSGSGLGLVNTRARLQSLYPDRFHLTLATTDVSSQVHITVPMQRAIA